MAKSKWTRREMLKTGLAISAGLATGQGARPLTGQIVDSVASADPALEKLPSGAKEPELQASSPGLDGSMVMITANQVKLRPAL